MDPAPPVLAPAASTVSPSSPAPPTEAPRMPALSLPRFGQLITETQIFFKKRAGVLIPLTFIASAISPALNLLGGGVSLLLTNLGLPEFIEVPLVLLAVFIGFVLSVWAWAALAFAVALSDEAIGIREAFGRSLKNIVPFLWLSVLTNLLLTLGFFAFLVPALIFMIWFMFAQYVFVLEGKRGIAALLTSKEYVRGLFAAILGRYLLLVLLSVAIGLAVAAFSVGAIALAFVSPLLSIAAISLITLLLILAVPPFLLGFTFVLFKHVRQAKGGISAAVTTKQRVLWGGLATLGLLVGIVLFAGVILIATLSAIKNIDQAGASETQAFGLFSYQLALEFHYVEHQAYPATLGDMLIEDQSLTALERAEAESLSYEVSDDGQSYALCMPEEGDKIPVCVTGGGDDDHQRDIVE